MVVTDGAPEDYASVFQQYNWKNSTDPEVGIMKWVGFREIKKPPMIVCKRSQGQFKLVHNP